MECVAFVYNTQSPWLDRHQYKRRPVMGRVSISRGSDVQSVQSFCVVKVSALYSRGRSTFSLTEMIVHRMEIKVQILIWNWVWFTVDGRGFLAWFPVSVNVSFIVWPSGNKLCRPLAVKSQKHAARKPLAPMVGVLCVPYVLKQGVELYCFGQKGVSDHLGCFPFYQNFWKFWNGREW